MLATFFATGFLGNLFYILIAFIILLFMVTIHELGHYISGKLLGFKINEFAIGMGPKIYSKKMKSGEIFSLRALPLGGFCAFEGEDEEKPDNNQAFNSQKPWKRLITLFSGAAFNFLSAIFIVIIAFSCFGDAMLTISNVYEASPNYASHQLEKGDAIFAIEGKRILLSMDLSAAIAKAPESMSVTVMRDGKKVVLEGIKKGKYTVPSHFTVSNYAENFEDGDTLVKVDGKEFSTEKDLNEYLLSAGENLSVTVIRDNDFKEIDVKKGSFTVSLKEYYGLGVGLVANERTRYSLGESMLRSVPYCFRVGGMVLDTLGGLITGRVGIDEIGGPITTIDIISDVAGTGFANILVIITLISVNLAIFNLLPIPALDGSRMVFVIIEWIRGKPINRKVEGYIHLVGIICLFAFVIIIDILKWV